ncbi:MAG: PrsW family intramembrane metalloprotease [Lachnospiraceae bacterium]|nr:PrsW family intramembrane metalloprotease [Lachnospiraceae bacterium]
MLTLLAVLPSIVLFVIVWKGDKIEKEPPKLLLKLFFFGMLTTASAIIIGLACTGITKMFISEESMLYIVLDNFIFTALVEEGGKYFVLKKCTWKHKAFNYTFDAVLYAVVVSLGFATLENILYLIDEGVGLALMRGLLSVPGHVIDAIYMGCYYGIARYEAARGNVKQSGTELKKALLIPVLLHGFYDFCLSSGRDVFLLVFLVFEIIITILAIKKFKKLSKGDTEIPGSGEDAV